ncbi:hypothetical protein P4G36_27760 (plasmid) [Escherichia coli]|uniref:hypothetical protein n=1 Tax=Enterobacteriaceae TaxID=543 RepID=UPI0009730482|nr:MULTISPECIES: hypothetical protein [Enterobacteriaceae]EFC4278595.1 hypothetical protein [Escherichia coli]MDS1461113.1 hypothetical protein [Escherichia coli]SIZ57880.1 Uncharacterised protein [Shigella sonnei]SJF75216.1 Uncharacterised protein [Shigella sonnei]
MLYVLIAFFCTIFSISSVDEYVNVNNHLHSDSDIDVAYVSYLLQRHYFSYLYCINGNSCETGKLQDVGNYLPSFLVDAPLQKNIYSCGNPVSNGGFVVLTTFKHTDSFKNVFFKKAVTDVMIDNHLNIPISVFYNTADMRKELFFQFINKSCGNIFQSGSSNIYFVSYFPG